MPSVPANVCGVAGEAAKAAALGLPRPAPVAGASERLPGSVSGYTFRRCECDGLCVPIRVTAYSPNVSPCVREIGRASLRARVFQSVYLLVVAYLLKKKKYILYI